MATTIANWNTLPAAFPRDGISRKAFSGKNSMITMFEIQPGTAPDPHSHAHEQLVYIVSGKAEFVVGEEVLKVKAGDLLVVPSNVPHSLKVIGSEPVLNINVFSPIRNEYA
jgi:quercetin dioxygenase-like cupin family protein